MYFNKHQKEFLKIVIIISIVFFVVKLYKLPYHKQIAYNCSILSNNDEILYEGIGNLELTIYPKIFADNYYEAILTIDDTTIPLKSYYPATLMRHYVYFSNKLTRKDIYLYQTIIDNRIKDISQIRISRGFNSIYGYSTILTSVYGKSIYLQGTKK